MSKKVPEPSNPPEQELEAFIAEQVAAIQAAESTAAESLLETGACAKALQTRLSREKGGEGRFFRNCQEPWLEFQLRLSTHQVV
jgi:hypothetical protein